MTHDLTMGDVRRAASRIAGEAIRTPLLKSRFLDELLSADIHLKPENLQRTGSFKFRGAFNALASMSDSDRAKGIVAVSSGNHAQGVAEAARLFGVPATIVMPMDAPAIKVDRVRRSGAEVVPYDRYNEDREAVAREVLQRQGGTFVHPFEDWAVMAGQGTAGLESADDLWAEGITPDLGLICCGGGGLTAGVSTAWRDAFPEMAIYAVEPEGFDDTARSLVSGVRETNDPSNRSICDAIVTERPGANTFPINQRNGVKGLVVTDQNVLVAMAFAYRELKLIVEPGGAVALAALLSGKISVSGKSVVAVLSGGNADPALIQRALKES